MTRTTLKADKRKVFGKKVKQIRRQNLVPANLFGKGIKSLSLQITLADFQKAFKEARFTQIVYLKVGDKETPTLIQNLQRHPIKRTILHADFRKMDLKQKTETQVPIEVLGELEVIKSGEADLNLILEKITVECLPTSIPEKITVDISKLEGIGAEIKVKDLPKSTDYEYKEEQEQVVLHISESKVEEIPVPVVASEEEETKEGEEPKEGEETKEGEEKEGGKPAETKPEDKKEEKNKPKEVSKEDKNKS